MQERGSEGMPVPRSLPPIWKAGAQAKSTVKKHASASTWQFSPLVLSHLPLCSVFYDAFSVVILKFRVGTYTATPFFVFWQDKCISEFSESAVTTRSTIERDRLRAGGSLFYLHKSCEVRYALRDFIGERCENLHVHVHLLRRGASSDRRGSVVSLVWPPLAQSAGGLRSARPAGAGQGARTPLRDAEQADGVNWKDSYSTVSAMHFRILTSTALSVSILRFLWESSAFDRILSEGGDIGASADLGFLTSTALLSPSRASCSILCPSFCM